MLSRTAAWNALQLRHGASQGRESASAFPLDERFEGFTNQCRFIRKAGEFLGDSYEIIIQCNRGSHPKFQCRDAAKLREAGPFGLYNRGLGFSLISLFLILELIL